LKRSKPPSSTRELVVYLSVVAAIFLALIFWIAATGCAIPPSLNFRPPTAPATDCMATSGVTALVGALAAWAATSGWLVQWNNSRIIARKQHTMNVLLTRSHSELFNTHMINVRSAYRLDHQLTAQEAADFNTAYGDPAQYKIHETTRRAIVPPAASVVYIANYFESIAAAIMSGDMDERLVKRTLLPTFLSTVARYWPVLKGDIGIANFGDEPPGEYATYSELYRLTRHWGLKAEHVDNFDPAMIEAIANSQTET
jgi:hypothetical protein